MFALAAELEQSVPVVAPVIPLRPLAPVVPVIPAAVVSLSAA
jgi:hypothetical protein